MGRKSIPILLKATTPEGETKTFTSIGEAAKKLGFSERGVGKAFHEKRNRTVCVYCNKPLTHEDRVKDGFSISKLNEKTGYPMEDHEVKSIYKAHKLTGLSVSSLTNAADKGNAIITRRKDKQRFILYWQSIHKRCFEIRREERWLETRRKISEEVKRKKLEEEAL